MNSALSPREIQSRLRAGASIPEVAAEAGVDVDRIDGFAIPVMAERAHMTRTALAAAVRRRGDGSGHRRLGHLIQERLQSRGLDADTVEWDSWRQNDLKWRLVGLLDDQVASRAAEFVFDPKGRFSVADNPDARWMIGEELPGRQGDPDNENTIDFHDELALVRATSDDPAFVTTGTSTPGDDVPPLDASYETSAHTSELDELYDMLSGVSEDSVRIYLGLEDDAADAELEARQPKIDGDDSPAQASDTDGQSGPADESESDESLADELSEHPDLEAAVPTDGESIVNDQPATTGTVPEPADRKRGPQAAPKKDVKPARDTSAVTPEQDPLVPDPTPGAKKRKPARKRASIPSWDEIMFGGPTPH